MGLHLECVVYKMTQYDLVHDVDTVLYFAMLYKHRFRYPKIISIKMLIFSYPSVLTYVSGALVVRHPIYYTPLIMTLSHIQDTFYPR